MTCREARDLIHGMLDSELLPDERSRLDEHLADCGSCQRYAGVFAALKQRLSLMRAEAASGSGHSRVRAFFESGAESPAPPFLAGLSARPRFMWAAAAAVLVAFGVFAAMAILAPSQSLADSALEQHHLRTAGQLVLDTHANCCKDLQEWFQTQVEHPVDVPEITYEGLEVEGGKLYRHASGNEMFFVACSVENLPVSVFVCCGPDIEIPPGRRCECPRGEALIDTGSDFTMLSWRRGENIIVLLAPFDVEKTHRLCAAIE